MRALRNQEGIALVVALMFVLICLGVILALLDLVLFSTRSSGAQIRYRSALEASYGGVDFVANTVIPRLFVNYSSGRFLLQDDFGAASSLGLMLGPQLRMKLTTPTSGWGSSRLASTSAKELPDVTFTLPGQLDSQGYTVYTKIVDTIPGIGLLDGSGINYLDGGLGVAGRDSSIASPRTPTMYTLEVEAEKSVNPKEKANLTVLYAY